MVNDRQLSTFLKNEANKLFISCSLCSFIYRPFSLPKSVLSYDTYQSLSVTFCHFRPTIPRVP